MKIPYRKSITKIKTTKEIQSILEPYFGNRNNGEYFIGASVGPGWNDILLDLHVALIHEKPDYFIAQIKEKFATLRYYTGPMTDDGRKLIIDAEEKSAETCEECGRPGMLRDDGYWLTTLCGWDRNVRNLNIRLASVRRFPYTLYWKIRFGINRRRMKQNSTARMEHHLP